MAIHIGDKVVRSLPEEVSDLRKRIDELEEPKHLYQHNLILNNDDEVATASCIILSKRAEAYDLDSLLQYLIDGGFVAEELALLTASGEGANGPVLGISASEDRNAIKIYSSTFAAGGYDDTVDSISIDLVIQLF